MNFLSRKGVPALLVVLSSCAQLTIHTTISADSESLAQGRAAELTSDILNVVANLDGECWLRDGSNSFFSCKFFSGGESFNVGFGVDEYGDYSVSVFSTLSRWLPPSRRGIETGRMVSAARKEFEMSIIGLFDPEEAYSAQRGYVGFDFSESLIDEVEG